MSQPEKFGLFDSLQKQLFEKLRKGSYKNGNYEPCILNIGKREHSDRSGTVAGTLEKY